MNGIVWMRILRKFNVWERRMWGRLKKEKEGKKGSKRNWKGEVWEAAKKKKKTSKWWFLTLHQMQKFSTFEHQHMLTLSWQRLLVFCLSGVYTQLEVRSVLKMHTRSPLLGGLSLKVSRDDKGFRKPYRMAFPTTWRRKPDLKVVCSPADNNYKNISAWCWAKAKTQEGNLFFPLSSFFSCK